MRPGRRLKDTSGDVSKGDALVLPLHDRTQHSAVPILAMPVMASRSAPQNTRVSAPDDVAQVVQHRAEENELCGNL